MNKTLSNIFSIELNPGQRQAVEMLDGPLLVLAGAGSGKTRVLTYRIAHLIESNKARPEEILAMTFTNKAASEMMHRVNAFVQELNFTGFAPPWVSTFHSFSARFLRQEIHNLEMDSSFTILDKYEQLSLIKNILKLLNIDDKIYPPKKFQSQIAAAKIQNRIQFTQPLNEVSRKVFDKYEHELKKMNAIDFDDLLLKTFDVLEKFPNVLAKYQQLFKYILVDEYQDTNFMQYQILKSLSQKHRNLCVVGDEDQSIYSWRGADIRNILNFEKDFPDANVVRLEENYRSTQTIVDASSALIANNRQRKGKTLFSNNSAGEAISIREVKSEYDEAQYVVNTILYLSRNQKYKLREIAIFYRTNAQSRVFEELLRRQNLNYRLIGGVQFYERFEIKDALAYLKVLANPRDDYALCRIINSPPRKIGKATLEKIDQFAQHYSISWLESIPHMIDQNILNAATTRKLKEFLSLIQTLQQEAKVLTLSALYTSVIKRSAYIEHLNCEDTLESKGRIENLKEFYSAICHFEAKHNGSEALQTFLEEVALISMGDQAKDHEDHITLMTIHISKGLEFPVVFMVGMEENLFPSSQSLAENPLSCEEERRLAYVGMTRARKLLFLSCARIRRLWGQNQYNPPSRFLREIPSKFVKYSSFDDNIFDYKI